MSEDEFAARVQRKAEQHLADCNEAAWSDESGELLETPAFAPYCGCDTCIVREVLMVAWDDMLAEARAQARRELVEGVPDVGPVSGTSSW